MGAVSPRRRYRNPATLACFLVEFMSSPFHAAEKPADAEWRDDTRVAVSEEDRGENRSSLVRCLKRYDNFPSSVSFFKIPDRLRDLSQRVTPVDDRCDLSCFDQLFQDSQVRVVC